MIEDEDRPVDEPAEREAIEAEGCIRAEWAAMGRDPTRWLGSGKAEHAGE